MALQTKWTNVPSVPFTLGPLTGEVVLSSNSPNLYRVKMAVTLTSSLLPDQNYIINRVVGTSIFLGYFDKGINSRANLSAYSSGTTAIQVAEQDKRILDSETADEFTYEQDPVNARRVTTVDDQGNLVGVAGNPMPVTFDGDITIGDVSIVEGGNTMTVNDDGSINAVNIASLIPLKFDDINITNSVVAGQTVPTIVRYYVGGILGTLVATLTLTYDGSANLTNVART